MIVVVLAAIGFAALRFAPAEPWSSALLVLALALLSAAALRVTARRLLAAAAIIAAAMGGGIGAKAVWQRSSTARMQAAWHAQFAASIANGAKQSEAIAQRRAPMAIGRSSRCSPTPPIPRLSSMPRSGGSSRSRRFNRGG